MKLLTDFISEREVSLRHASEPFDPDRRHEFWLSGPAPPEEIEDMDGWLQAAIIPNPSSIRGMVLFDAVDAVNPAAYCNGRNTTF